MRSRSQFHSWRASIRDPALTLLLCIQCFLSFIAAPSVSLGLPGSHLVLEATLLAFALLVLLISQSPGAAGLAFCQRARHLGRLGNELPRSIRSPPASLPYRRLRRLDCSGLRCRTSGVCRKLLKKRVVSTPVGDAKISIAYN
jgi:hypothetical protein